MFVIFLTAAVSLHIFRTRVLELDAELEIVRPEKVFRIVGKRRVQLETVKAHIALERIIARDAPRHQVIMPRDIRPLSALIRLFPAEARDFGFQECRIAENMKKEEAEELKKKIEEAGGKVTLK